jgi:chromosome segregation ATPase
MPKMSDMKEQWLFHAILVALAVVAFFFAKNAISEFQNTMDSIRKEVTQVREAVTRFEERQSSLTDRFSRLEQEQDDHGLLLYNHDWRVRRLEENVPGVRVPRGADQWNTPGPNAPNSPTRHQE